MDNFGHCSISGSIVSTIHNDSLRNDTLICRIVVVDVKFEEDPNQKWGFDENDPIKENHYLSYNTTPIAGLPWKAVQNIVSDKIKINVIPNITSKYIQFKIADTVNFKLDVNTSFIEVKTNNLNNLQTFITPQIGKFSNDTTRILVKGCKPADKKLAIINIVESNDDIQVIAKDSITVSDTTVVITWGGNKFLDSKPAGDDNIIYRAWANDSVIIAGVNKKCDTKADATNWASTNIATITSVSDLKDYLNNILYKQVSIKFTDVDYYTDTINFDIDRDKKVNVEGNFPSNEVRLLIDKYLSKTINSKVYNYILFMVDNPSDGSYGWMGMLQSYGIIHPNTHTRVTRKHQFQNTIGHELGHGMYGLMHPFNQFHPSYGTGGKDPDNLMDYEDGDKLRAYQWIIIHP